MSVSLRDVYVKMHSRAIYVLWLHFVGLEMKYVWYVNCFAFAVICDEITYDFGFFGGLRVLNEGYRFRRIFIVFCFFKLRECVLEKLGIK